MKKKKKLTRREAALIRQAHIRWFGEQTVVVTCQVRVSALTGVRLLVFLN